jgi:hypothetical protein
MLITYIMLLEENPVSIGLQLLIVMLAAVIILLLYLERNTTSSIRQTVDDFSCPSCPTCPDCNCSEEGCPDCVCPESGKCPSCPKCPDVSTSCPTQKSLSVDDIVDAIFPGRNKGLTTHGQYFPLDGLGEGVVEPAYSPVTNLMPNYVGGDGVPAAISFSDQKTLNEGGIKNLNYNNSIALSTKKSPPIVTKGLFSQKEGSAPAPGSAPGSAPVPAPSP